MHGLSLEDYRVAARSLREVFPHVYIFHSPVGRTEWTIILGMLEPLRVDAGDIAHRMKNPLVKADLDEILVETVGGLVSTFVVGDATLGSFLGPSRLLNTDDLPYLEYVSPMSGVLRSREDLLTPLYTELVKHREPLAPYLTDGPPAVMEEIASACEAEGIVLDARLIELDKGILCPAAVADLHHALEVDPHDTMAMSLLSQP